MNKISKQDKQILVALAIIFALFLLWNLVILPNFVMWEDGSWCIDKARNFCGCLPNGLCQD